MIQATVKTLLDHRADDDLAVAKDKKLVGGDGKISMAARLSSDVQLDPSFGTSSSSRLPFTDNPTDATKFAVAVNIDAQHRMLPGVVVRGPGVHDRNRVARLPRTTSCERWRRSPLVPERR